MRSGFARRGLIALSRSLSARSILSSVKPTSHYSRESDMATNQGIRRAVERALKVERLRRDISELDEKARKAEQAENALILSLEGGPCRYCGITRSAVQTKTGAIKAQWYEDKSVCVWCFRERRPLGRDVPDMEHRERVVRTMVQPDVASRYIGHYLVEKAQFKWFAEVLGAKPHPRKRFAFTSGVELEQNLLPPKTPNVYSIREACPRCGCDRMWKQDPTPEPLYTASGKQLYPSQRRPISFTCNGCRALGPDIQSFINGIAKHIVGIEGSKRHTECDVTAAGTTRFSQSLSYAERIGITTWKLTEGAQPSAMPFAYLDVRELRRKAYDIVPKRDWLRMDLWQQQLDAHKRRYQESKRREDPRARVAQRSV